MLEVEMKFPVADVSRIEAHFRSRGVQPVATRNDVDLYFNSPDRDFALTDEALRIRRSGEKSFITYKGPKLDADTKTRTEVEIALAEGDQTAADCRVLLQSLGYRKVIEVRKRRTLYHLQRDQFDVEICLDDVEELGTFVEIEIVASNSDAPRAKEVLLAIAEEMGLAESERRAYLQLLLEKKGI